MNYIDITDFICYNRARLLNIKIARETIISQSQTSKTKVSTFRKILTELLRRET